ncbi:hypothetical protein CLV56_2391 [Mumia flava]|uniref:Sulfotransferase family protein n=1 Tax=Mumia flava TaxID=1348852 RepID=A0A0B2BQ67_9ACTN|nr:sulfotransferase family protein [Mumia flava]PJJ58146.1 hypothetical protein CLV56_2391 [Mumia flava]
MSPTTGEGGHPPRPDSDRRLVLVAGAGRSGTSTISGTLNRLGLHVPLPALKANASNPKGFYESWWPVRFHQSLMRRARIETVDGRPEAAERVRAVVTDEDRERLADWLGALFAEQEHVVVKDPRAAWAPWLWTEVADEVGIPIGFVTMVRHPAEVVGSRTTYYQEREGIEVDTFVPVNLCGWINANLLMERHTRGRDRVVVRYESLIEDWRAETRRISTALDLGLERGVDDPSVAADVDGFIDPGLRRHQSHWDGLAVPPDLRDVADDVYAGMLAVESDPAGSADGLDRARTAYETLYRDATSIAFDATRAAVAEARAETEREVRAAERRERDEAVRRTRDRLRPKLEAERRRAKVAEERLRHPMRNAAGAVKRRLKGLLGR